MSTDKKISDAIELAVQDHRRALEHMVETWCDSPIERLVLLEMLAHDGSEHGAESINTWRPPTQRRWRDIWDAFSRAPGVNAEKRPLFRGALSDEHDDLGACFQLHLSLDGREMRLDLAMIGEGVRIAVELDGHDFHERTKEQAQRDKSRDRLLSIAGWQVLRFTGSEVYRDVARVVSEINRAAYAAHETWLRAREAAKSDRRPT